MCITAYVTNAHDNTLPIMQWCLFTGVVPIEADFLFVLSTVVNSAGNHHKDGSLFIQSLVNVLGERLNDEHLEDALLKVKDKVASKNISSDDKMCKQMPSVLSQMRDRVWFHK